MKILSIAGVELYEDEEAATVKEVVMMAVSRRADLRRADLREANLRRAILSVADLRRADLRAANLREANLSRAILSEANLSGANLREANLSGATLSEANLRAANLHGATLSEANLSGAILHGATLSEANLREANLRRAILRGATLSEANLSGADLYGAILREANLSTIKEDFLSIIKISNEVDFLRAALIAGRVDGSVYKGECACLIGTIANSKKCDYHDVGVTPDSSRPAERWFLAIKPGDSADSNPVVAITLEWIDEFLASAGGAQ